MNEYDSDGEFDAELDYLESDEFKDYRNKRFIESRKRQLEKYRNDPEKLTEALSYIFPSKYKCSIDTPLGFPIVTPYDKACYCDLNRAFWVLDAIIQEQNKKIATLEAQIQE